MDHPGIGVMIQMLSGRSEEEVALLTSSIGKKIQKAWVDEEKDRLTIRFTDRSELHFKDEGQSCCESRYMSCDDRLSDFHLAEFRGAEIKEADSVEAEYDYHDQEFLEIQTSKGVFTVVNHNEHNGYYGGFYIRMSASEGRK
jgi:hypothetical protein